jgi:hypothetical protein
VPVALNCWVSPIDIDGDTGVTAIETRVGVDEEELPLLHPASRPASTNMTGNKTLFIRLPLTNNDEPRLKPQHNNRD